MGFVLIKQHLLFVFKIIDIWKGWIELVRGGILIVN